MITRSSGPPRFGFILVGIFFYFAMTMALYAAFTLLFPGTVLDRLWALNPRAHQELLPVRRVAGSMFLVLAVIAVTGGAGWFRRRMWAWRLSVLGMCTQFLGDFVSFVRGDFLRGSAGLLIASAFLIYLLKPQTKKSFNTAL